MPASQAHLVGHRQCAPALRLVCDSTLCPAAGCNIDCCCCAVMDSCCGYIAVCCFLLSPHCLCGACMARLGSALTVSCCPRDVYALRRAWRGGLGADSPALHFGAGGTMAALTSHLWLKHVPSMAALCCRQPAIVEIQIMRIGQFVILCVPGEFTTMAGRRLREAVAQQVRTKQAACGLSHQTSCRQAEDSQPLALHSPAALCSCSHRNHGPSLSCCKALHQLPCIAQHLQSSQQSHQGYACERILSKAVTLSPSPRRHDLAWQCASCCLLLECWCPACRSSLCGVMSMWSSLG